MEGTSLRVIDDLAMEDGNSAEGEDVVVNFKKGSRIILDRLLSFSPVLEIVCISVDGNGSTMNIPLTGLSQKLLYHDLARSYFQARLKVSVCEEASKVKFIVAYHFEKRREKNYSFGEGNLVVRIYFGVEDMIKDFHEALKSQRYLVVIRNYAPSFQDFLHIQSWFPEDYNGSRVILATTCVHGHLPFHPPVQSKPFSLQMQGHFREENLTEAWEYLRDKVFAEKSCPLELTTMGMQIAKNCLGVQPVLDHAARLLSETGMRPWEWEKIVKSDVFQIILPEKEFYIFQSMLQLSEQIDFPMIDEEKEKENAVVGLDDDLIEIKHQLTRGSRLLEIITVVGIGGIGKTTLAKAVFYDPLIQYHFNFRAWIKVTEFSELRDLLLVVLQHFLHLDDQIDGLEMDELIERLYENLKQRRFLIVMDDLCNSQAWDSMKRCFPDDNNGSRILLTSPVKNLENRVWSNKPPHEMRLLNKDQSWQLMHNRIFSNRSCPPQLAEVGKRIADKCEGLPSSIVSTAGVLSNVSENVESWEKFAESLNSISTGDPEKCLEILDLKPQENVAEKEQESVVVGLDDALLKIKHQLTGQSRQLEIITIVGMGGIGKTTLAKAVFDDPLIQYHFYVRAWIKVSQVYQLRELLLEVLHNTCHLDDQTGRMNTEQLKEQLHRKLKGQRFLIVMDDLWNTQAWDSMKRCFPDDKNGSRILLTTRLKNLATHASSNLPPHEMRLLDKKQSWELMHYQIFAKKICPNELVGIGKKIAEKCQGLPLSIVVIGGVLSNMSWTCDSWGKVAENLNSVLTSDHDKCLNILALSYHYLPNHLKACFLYTCAFPEDSEIDCRRLKRLWVAEGFVKEESGRSLEDLAEQHLEDLVKRSLVLVGKRKSNGGIKTCLLHDILRDLSLREARKENFMQVITRNIQVHSEGIPFPCRLSFHSGSGGNFHPDPTVQLNSFLCFEVEFGTIPDIGFTLSKFNFKLLRVLDINFLRFDYFPDLILNLIHLRFLALTAACELPSSISKLLNLQMLIVHGPWLSRKHGKTPTLPMEIWRMSQLRHLNLSAAILLGCLRLDEDNASNFLFLTNLQTLSTIRSTSCTEQLFQSLPSLKKLGIRQIREDLDTQNGSSDFLKSLLHLHQLETLKCCFYVQNRKTTYLPKWQAFPQRLKKLTLSGGSLPWTEMETLGMLQNLEVLKLKNYAFRGPIWEAADDGFPSLKVLLFDKTDLVHWNANRYSFPRLESLVLRFCESLKEIPHDIADDMQLIELHCCSCSAESSAREIQEEQRDRDNDGLVVRIISKGQMSSAESNVS